MFPLLGPRTSGEAARQTSIVMKENYLGKGHFGVVCVPFMLRNFIFRSSFDESRA
jgi:hypothetical protein